MDGIIAALLEEFPDADVYQEQIRQGFQEPCFLVRNLNAAERPAMGNRSRRLYSFSVQYFPQSAADAKAECYGVCDTLFQLLAFIKSGGDLVRGTGMNGEVWDGALTFTVNYNLFVRTEPERNPMETLDIENKAR